MAIRNFVIHGLFVSCLLVMVTPLGLPAQEAGFALRPAFQSLAERHNPGHLQPARRIAAAQYDVIALRVEFQPDTSRFSTGDGTFGDAIYEGIQVRVDPLPHDAAFFNARLSFLKHYVERISNGRTRVHTHLIPEVVRLDHVMGTYSPTGPDADSDEELRKLAGMVQEAWQKASAQSGFDMSGFDPERTALIIFHAGSGRDIELTGTVLDKTPEDVPSLVFGEQALQRLLDNAQLSFNGFPVNHTILLPRTHSRLGFNFITRERFVAEFSTNGMLAASFFSFLGVPDLFDTETGQSGIGPFGLMDPYGIFAYNGLFPPEPTAWTKYYLGWLEPDVVTGSEPQDLRLRANSVEGTSQALKVPVSESEYFLIENRNRDPFDEELTLDIWRDGTITQQRVAHRNEGLSRFDVSDFDGGTVIAASNYDWALPGGVGEDGRPQTGGILIWHIDERRIAERLPANRVNVGPDQRAINLKEADSAQDIGFPAPSPLGPQPHVGTPFDFFYEGNPVRVVTGTGREIRLYRNRFGPDTHPSSNSNQGGPSFIVVEDFSVPGVEMTLRYSLEPEAGIAPQVTAGELDLGVRAGGRSAVVDFDAGERTYHMVYADDERVLVAVDANEHTVESTWTAVAALPAVWQAGQLAFVQGSEGVRDLVLWDGRDEVRTGIPAEYASGEFTTPIVSLSSGDGRWLYAGWQDGAANWILRMHPDGVFEAEDVGSDNPVLGISAIQDGRIAVVTREWMEIRPEGTRHAVNLTGPISVAGAAFGGSGDHVVGFLYTPEQGVATWLLPGGRTAGVQLSQIVSPPVTVLSGWQPALMDVGGNGSLDAVFGYGRYLFAVTQGGAVTSGFPVELPAPVIGQPVIVRIADRESPLVVVGTEDGYLRAIDVRNGRAPVKGFPLALGSTVGGTVQVRGHTLTAVSGSGSFRKWRWDDVSSVPYGRLFGTDGNHSFLHATGIPVETPAGTALLVSRETYNWPNPIRDGYTFLRVEVTRAASVNILITDITGARIDEIDLPDVFPGVPTEVRWDTNASSGVYLARVRATSEGGHSETGIVRMAIIR